MSQYNVSTQVNFWSTDIIIGEIQSASDAGLFALEGKTIGKAFIGQRQSLEDFGNRYLLRAKNGQWIEFAYA